MSLSLSINYMLFFEFCLYTLFFEEMSLYCSSVLFHGVSHLSCSHFMTGKPMPQFLSSCSATYPSVKCCLKLKIDSSYFYIVMKCHIIYINKWNHLYKSKRKFSVKYIISQILQYLMTAQHCWHFKVFHPVLSPSVPGGTACTPAAPWKLSCFLLIYQWSLSSSTAAALTLWATYSTTCFKD